MANFDPFEHMQEQKEVTINIKLKPSLEPLGVHFISTSASRQPRISSFDMNSRAIGVLVLGDKITHVNGVESDGATNTAGEIRDAVQRGMEVNLTVQRQETIEVCFSKASVNASLGMKLTRSSSDGLWVTGLHQGGISANTFLIATPCHVVAVNGKAEVCESMQQTVSELQAKLNPTLTLRYGGKTLDLSHLPPAKLVQFTQVALTTKVEVTPTKKRGDSFDEGLRI